MLDCIIGYDHGHEIWKSDLYPYETFIGYIDRKGSVHMYTEG